MSIQEKLSNLLLSNERYQAENTEEQKVLNKTLVSAYAREYNPELLSLLQSDEDVKNHFFVQVNDTVIFKLENFLTFINNRSFLPDSFTAFKNKIGLATDKENYLNNSREVVLNWAYKDCVLEGGQSKDDQKRNEVFFNEVLAPDQINRLLDDKVFTNFKRYDKDGEHEVTELQKNDNLIIKGNNLVVLHSLKKRFAGKVKLIYIDPPYNTGNDSFGYNDKFNHSTWLTFMKNRLEVAKTLLHNNGLLFINIDDIEEAYLKVLCDEIYGRDNFINVIAVKSSTPSGTKTAHKDKTIIKQKDLILVYKKGEVINLTPQYTKREKWDTHYSLILEKHNNVYTLFKLADRLYELDILGKEKKLDDLNIDDKKFKEYYLQNADKICRLQSHKNKEADKISRKRKDEVYEHIIDGVSKGLFYNGQVITPLSQGIKKVHSNQKIVDDLGMLLCDFWADIDFQNTQNEGGVSFPTAKKPEMLLSRIISLVTNEGDIVLDYHLGSGTTCAVAHKMNRQYIGIEQMNYGKDDSVKRLQNVLQGELSGISKSVNWQGGGEFVYCELANDAEKFRNEVRNADAMELPMLLEKAKQSSFLSYRVEREKFNNFENLTEGEQRTLLLQLVDTNTLYVNYSDIESADYEISEADKKLNKQFYGK